MKNLKYITIITYLFILSSCQNETIDIEEQVVDASEIKLIDQSYAEDLELYKETLIVFENSEHSIEEVLTDPVLFSKYKDAETHYHKINEQGNFKYVFDLDEEGSKKLISSIELQKGHTFKKGIGYWQYRVVFKAYSNKNYKGASSTFDVTKSGDPNRIKTEIPNLGNVRKRISSFKYEVDMGGKIHFIRGKMWNKIRDGVAHEYVNSSPYKKHHSDLTPNKFPIKNDALEKVTFDITTK